ncbi:MAG: metallophosphoesterase family protein [Planctomycetota bacterium]
MGRTFVLGDIHGCDKALRTMLECIAPATDDTLIFLGDYIDRGPDSRGVVSQLIDLRQFTRTIFLRGNHEVMLCGVMDRGCDDKLWLRNGGQATVNSYGGSLTKIPDAHRQFFRDLRSYHEGDEFICVHAHYDPTTPMHLQTDQELYWRHLSDAPPAPHVSGKTVFLGHTPQASGQVLNCGYLVCLDTYCFGGGYLSAMCIDDETILQTNRHGHLRSTPLSRLTSWIRNGWNQLGNRFNRSPDDEPQNRAVGSPHHLP